MKLSFTTLGCPNWDLDTILSKAVAYGYDAVDFRGYLGEMDIFKLPEFSSDLEKTKQKFKEASLKVSCFSSSVRLFTNTDQELRNHLEELEQYGQLCKAFHTPYIRVFGGKIGDSSREAALETVTNNLHQMLPIAETYDVVLLLETHDDWTNCEYVEAVLNHVDSSHLQVLWDVHHPYRTVGENPELTWETLGEKITYTHWKDSYVKENTPRGYQLCLLGKGDIPLQQIYDLLQEKGYDGYYTLEWEKVWCPEIEEPEVAFEQYVNYMKQLAKKHEITK
ncbi:sugar phosphate isomerase/epimerase family protein [Aquibacillus albus]|uniref:Sugar phosphate isomerase/epimerase n=1 Tax=Aquibacillus albus TaxID=1168171 RepID=A0ABS2MWY1_9BACI|nr:sugar phosphate isomerase/epimerase family protein [Aquibacillus albus]MBM7570372.1 sugar phosphate isomerase/epimerase [Aquibacillus albus]